MDTSVGDWWTWLIEAVRFVDGEHITVEKSLHSLQNSLEQEAEPENMR